jgi:hypothetical protein
LSGDEKSKDGDTVATRSPRPGRDSAVLRKRTMSAGDVPKFAGGEGSGTGTGKLKAGQSILEQIGAPDHNGWMRKKGERYNSWKMRYFVLKGSHLYCLRSNSKAVGPACSMLPRFFSVAQHYRDL